MNTRVSLVLACAAIAFLFLAPAPLLAQDLPELTQPVNDFANVIDGANAADMDRMIRALQQATGDVVVVATVPTYAPFGDIREYAVKLFQNHGKGVGEKDKHNGLLILLAVKEHKVWVEVGYGLEEWITDGFAGETSRQYMIPAFRRNDYGGGLKAGVERIIGRIAEARNVKLDGVQPVRKPQKDPGMDWGFIIILILIGIFVVLRSGGGGGFVGRPRYWGGGGWSGWSSGIGSFGGGGGGGFGGGFGGFGGGGSGGGGGGGSW